VLAVLLVVLVAEPGPSLDAILSAFEARERAMSAFAASFHETEKGRRFGPRRFAWGGGRSLYRGPKEGEPFAAWLQGDRPERESVYYRDGGQELWLHRELEPFPLVWEGTRRESSGPDYRSETGLHWDDRPWSVLLRERDVRIEGPEAVDGHPCVRLLVLQHGEDPWPVLLWLSEEFDFFPWRVRDHRLATTDPRGRPGYVRAGKWWYVPTHTYDWRGLGRRGAAVYPLSIRIRDEHDPEGERLIEVVPESVRIGADVTDEDFELPAVFFVKDLVGGGYAAMTPLGRISLVGAVLVAAAVVAVMLVRRRLRA
jgi:hypothetical protein